MHAPRKPDHDRSADRSRSLVRPAPALVTAKPDTPAGPGGAMTPGQVLALQRSVGNAAVSRMVEEERHVHGAGCGHETPETPVQRTAVHDVLDTPGQPFTGPLRTEMEDRFGGADFSGVRLHTDSAAQKSATEIGARAYTSGNHVVFGPGPIEPKVMAHELRHTQQQAAGQVAGTDHGDGLSMSDKGDDFEKEAEAVAEQVMSSDPVTASAPAPGPSAGPAAEAPVQRVADGRAAPVAVQRVGESSESAAEQPAQDVKGKELIHRLSQSIEDHTIETKPVVSPWAPGTWWPEDWMPAGKARLRRTLDRRVLAGEVFGAQDLADIEALTTVNPDWLKDVGIGTISEAQEYTRKGNYKDWLNLPAGKRVLTATLAYNNHLKGAPIPDNPAYTLARFFNTKGRNLTEEQKQPLRDERDQQIRETAVRTLHPAAIPPQDMHADANKAHVTQHQAKADKARDVFTNVLLVLQHGLKIYDKKQEKHLDYRDGDVIRALAHGGRVNIRIPALNEGEAAASLTDFLGVTEGGGLAEHVEPRDYATHGNDIGKNKGDKRGKFKETGGALVALKNKVLPGGPDLSGLDIPGGGFGSKDWNGDVVLPTGSHGHMLLVFTAPTKTTDGALQVGIETTGPDKPSTVGYKHDFRSTEATANPESVMHGHKRDKLNERYVDLKELGKAQGGGDWRAFLDDIKQGWYAELNKTKDGSDERQALYRQLVGRRQHFYDET
ncbi:DUF4157 domain-containing protein [Streptomyces sp. NPDC021098]|uniref:eCIS core domain-containing protein n=1 Tax=unclassified Streptomyces TaxID=2593676 RepID=UPI003793C75A